MGDKIFERYKVSLLYNNTNYGLSIAMGSACNKTELSARPITIAKNSNKSITSTWICSPLSKTIQRHNLTHRSSLPPLKNSNSRKAFFVDQDSKEYIATIKKLNAKKNSDVLLELHTPSLNSSNGLQGISCQDNSSLLPYTSSIKKPSYYKDRHDFHKYYTSIAENKQNQEQNYSRGYTTYQHNKFLENRTDIRSTERTSEKSSFLETLRINNELSKKTIEKRVKDPNAITSGVITISYVPKRNGRLELAIMQENSKRKLVEDEKPYHTIRRTAKSCMVDKTYKTSVHKNVLKKITLHSRKDNCCSKKNHLSRLDSISKEEQGYISRAKTPKLYDIEKASATTLFDDTSCSFIRCRTGANDISMISNNSTIIENTMVVTKVDDDGNKYINQYRIEKKLGK